MNIIQTMKTQIEHELISFYKETKTKKLIIGVSGGVDSAVTLAIAVKSVGKKNVLALLLPYKLGEISSFENFKDAENLCISFGVEYKKIELDDFVKPYLYLETFTQSEKNNPLFLGNTLARIRMTLLFSYANATKGIVLGTCNLSEVLLGYETKFGDGAADISVIGNLWKSEVYDLAKEYNLPETFITKSPSAELYQNQSDEAEMGFSYETAEIVLSALINIPSFDVIKNKAKTIQLLSSIITINGITKEIIEKIYTMYVNSEHKRAPMPILLEE